MSEWKRKIPFQVDIAGVIDIMGSSLYSRYDTPIRELLQNAHDAIMRRRRGDLQFQGKIVVRQDANAGTLSFTDDGVGLTPEDAENYLGTVGLGITGLIKRGTPPPSQQSGSADNGDLIGQFGVGLFSAFMLADRLVVESRNEAAESGVRWEAGPGTEIDLSNIERSQAGTTVTLILKSEYRFLAENSEAVETAIRDHADFLLIPIFLNDSDVRVNVIHAAWFDAQQDPESTELAIEEYFDETPLDVIPIRIENPVSISGALYVSPQRVPGFSDLPTVMVTVRRMVISRKLQGILPVWATFLRGCIELHDCSPTASREDLVRNRAFENVCEVLEQILFEHFDRLAETDPQRMESIVNWHRYSLAGAAIENERLRQILKQSYRFPTSHGPLTIQEILEKSEADPLFEDDVDRVVWYNPDRRQERWINSLFASHSAPCVSTFRSFEESLLAQCLADDFDAGIESDLRLATPTAPNFSAMILGVQDLEDAAPEWIQFLESSQARVLLGSFRADQPVMAFLNERHELAKSFEELKQRGEIPTGFQRLIDTHFADAPTSQNEIILNRNHPMISRALSQKPGTPLSCVVRLIVANALNSAGGTTTKEARQQQQDDLDWIAECLWGRDS
ncbi:HSP90 family protein [Thalassoglobus neptunius]|nr:ATP-binding protein [Thalassoglobus neptunius]